MMTPTQEMASIHHTPLLVSKLHMPHLLAQLVERSVLYERLAQGMTGALTLLSAPAGGVCREAWVQLSRWEKPCIVFPLHDCWAYSTS